MIGTLVVMLPGDAKGGVLEVERSGTTTMDRSSKTSLSFGTCFADCRHQVKPVTSGYRVVLTWNLMPHGDTRPWPAPRLIRLVDSLAQTLGLHFTTRIPVRYGASDRRGWCICSTTSTRNMA